MGWIHAVLLRTAGKRFVPKHPHRPSSQRRGTRSPGSEIAILDAGQRVDLRNVPPGLRTITLRRLNRRAWARPVDPRQYHPRLIITNTTTDLEAR